mmetsp:Transcript_20522/g.53488  ORF Transcript_20522/g.53488 Transcript_20522/m.53488 type:complete len:213 (+) Transcript_20522:532-1170(+)
MKKTWCGKVRFKSRIMALSVSTSTCSCKAKYTPGLAACSSRPPDSSCQDRPRSSSGIPLRTRSLNFAGCVAMYWPRCSPCGPNICSHFRNRRWCARASRAPAPRNPLLALLLMGVVPVAAVVAEDTRLANPEGPGLLVALEGWCMDWGREENLPSREEVEEARGVEGRDRWSWRVLCCWEGCVGSEGCPCCISCCCSTKPYLSVRIPCCRNC